MLKTAEKDTKEKSLALLVHSLRQFTHCIIVILKFACEAVGSSEGKATVNKAFVPC